MRRIIERVVTVVTTTTWKISWEPDPHPSQPSAAPVSEEFAALDALAETPSPTATASETKEVRLPEEENAPDQP